MRLSILEVQNILNLKDKYFGKDSKIYLFGSRIDDKKKGGDIDLYIETEKNDYNLKISFLAELDNAIGSQKIDLVFARDTDRLIEKEAIKGVEMNLDKIKLQKHFNECKKHLERMEGAFEDIQKELPLTAQKYTELSKHAVQAIDQYLFRFAKLQDTLGEKIFKLIISQYDSSIEQLTFADTLNRLEKLEYLYSAQEWMNLRKLRNDIAHQYDDEPNEMSMSINNIFAQFGVIKDIFLKLQQRAEQQNILIKNTE